MNPASLRNWYMWLVAVCGIALTALCSYKLDLAHLDSRFVIIALITILIGSRITISIPKANGEISVSDTFIFLTILLFGPEAAVILAAVEAFASSVRFSKKIITWLFNTGAMASSTFATAWILHNTFGNLRTADGYSANLIIALCVMALVQYALNSGLVAISVALQANEPIWGTWRKNFMWTSMTYFAGASAAGIVARLIDQVGFYALLATTPMVAIIYFTYKTYLRNLENSEMQAELARRHVAELNTYIAEQERISKALQESEEHFRTAFDHAAIGMALVSPEGYWLRVNPSLCDILGYTEEELLNSDFQAITHRDDLGTDLAQVYRMLSGEILTCQLEKRFIHRDEYEVWALTSASLVHDATGNPLHFIFQIQDITERRRAEAAIQTLSLVDELTGLYNRRGFLAFSKQHLNSVHRNHKDLIVVYADLDGLKKINDSFGHKEGDRALIKTAEILKETFRSSDVLSRLGGDEFTVLAAVEPDGGAEAIIGRLEYKLQSYNSLKAVPYNLSMSLGYVLFNPEENRSIDDLMALADKAMYENKRNKRIDPIRKGNEADATGEAVA